MRARDAVFVLACAGIAAALGGCDNARARDARVLTGGEPSRAEAAFRRYGCGSCHEIPGVAGARGTVGPPLQRVGVRQYLAGRVVNTPDNMIRWIRTPQHIEPGTVMPDLGVSDRDARDIAAYLYTLR